MIRVYLDTVITSGRILRDLRPPAEMAAVDRFDRFHDAGRIKIVTSKMSRIEQERTRDPGLRQALSERADEVSVVASDHRLLGFQTADLGARGFISSPLITDIVDEDVFARLLAAGVRDADAMHLMYAIANDCTVFVTLDTRDILPRRDLIEAACPQIQVRKPTEFVAELQTVEDANGEEAR
jgi:hypothetical protein